MDVSTSDVELLNVKQVAALLNCSQRHVFRLAESGRMPRPIKLGQLVRWNRSTLDEWIAKGCEPFSASDGKEVQI